ncbi:unnamed protein product [Ixodes hexagonus]
MFYAGRVPLVTILCCCGFLATAGARSCPDAAAFRPCACDIQGINCGTANSTSVLREALKTAGPKEHVELWIQMSPLESFPAGILGDFVFRKINIDLNANLTFFSIAALKKTRPFLTKLSLFGNALTSFQFEGIRNFPKLVELNVGKNQLETIPARALQHPTLSTLVLSDNPIVSIGAYAFAGLPQLKTLHLVGTRITALGDYALSIPSGNPDLKILLSDGNLTSVSALAFSDTSPRVLYLKGNHLTEFPRAVFYPIIEQLERRRQSSGKSSSLKVSGNPFSCAGCSFKWLVRLKNELLSRRLLSGFVCSDGTTLERLSYQKIGC